MVTKNLGPCGGFNITRIKINNNSAEIVEQEFYTSGMVGAKIAFQFSEEWNGLTKTIVFRTDHLQKDVLNVTNVCTIPHECLEKAGERLVVGVYGTNGNDIVIPTIYVSLGRIKQGADPSGDVSIDPTLPVWAQIQALMGNLNDLNTEAKSNLVAAVNEVKQTADNKQDKLIAGENITIAADGKTISATGGGGGISTTAKNLLITILRNGVYTGDQSANITALETALGGGEVPDVPDIPDIPDVPVVKTYTITRELINVTSNNNQNSISEGAAYMATLTADDGYVLPSTEQGGSISITMGGIDITSNVYNYRTGDINVSSVTGNIVITAVCAKEAALPVNGLDDYFDFRNAELYDLGSYKSYKATTGNGVIFGNANDSIKTDDKGLLYARYVYSTDGTASWNDYSAPFTFASLTYTEAWGGASPYSPNNIKKMVNASWNLCPTYTTTSGTTTQLSITPQAALTKGYHTCFISIDENNVLKVYVDGDLVQTYSGADYSDFASWKGFQALDCTQYSVDHATAFAMWGRALTEEELSEVERYLRTLEVA